MVQSEPTAYAKPTPNFFQQHESEVEVPITSRNVSRNSNVRDGSRRFDISTPPQQSGSVAARVTPPPPAQHGYALLAPNAVPSLSIVQPPLPQEKPKV